MASLQIRAHVLKRFGAEKTLALAYAHNSRVMYPRNGLVNGIQLSKSWQNLELISLKSDNSEQAAADVMLSRGIDPLSREIQARHRGWAIELVITVTSGHKCTYDALFAEAVEGLIKTHPESVVIHAIVHYDQGQPHCHLIMVPILDGRLQADKLRGYVNETARRNQVIFESLRGAYGLEPPSYLCGALKEKAAKLAIEALHATRSESVVEVLGQQIEKAIAARPEPFLKPLGITYADILRGLDHR